MCRFMMICLIASAGLSACHKETAGDAVREAYDNKADAVDQQGAAQTNETARKIYAAHADAIREEGKDREKGLEGRDPSKSPAGTGGASVGSGSTPQ